MKKKQALFLVTLIAILLVSVSTLFAQTSPGDPNMTSTQFDMTGFPQWAKDLRRGSIIAFGSFPFMYFFSNFGVDTYRWIGNSQGNPFNEVNRGYAPWPFNSAETIPKTQGQKLLTIGIAAGGAVLVALIDFGIEVHKRKLRERETMNYPEGTPIIIRRPLYDDDAGTDGSGPP